MEIIDAKVEEAPKYETKQVTIKCWNRRSFDEQLQVYKSVGWEVADVDEQKWQPECSLPHIYVVKLRRAIKKD